MTTPKRLTRAEVAELKGRLLALQEPALSEEDMDFVVIHLQEDALNVLPRLIAELERAWEALGAGLKGLYCEDELGEEAVRLMTAALPPPDEEPKP